MNLQAIWITPFKRKTKILGHRWRLKRSPPTTRNIREKFTRSPCVRRTTLRYVQGTSPCYRKSGFAHVVGNICFALSSLEWMSYFDTVPTRRGQTYSLADPIQTGCGYRHRVVRMPAFLRCKRPDLFLKTRTVALIWLVCRTSLTSCTHSFDYRHNQSPDIFLIFKILFRRAVGFAVKALHDHFLSTSTLKLSMNVAVRL